MKYPDWNLKRCRTSNSCLWRQKYSSVRWTGWKPWHSRTSYLVEPHLCKISGNTFDIFRSSQVAWKIKKYQRNDGPDTHVGCSRCIPWADLFVEVFKSFKYLTHVLGATSSREMYSFRFHWYQRENGGKPFCKTRRSRQRDFFWFPTCKGMFTAKLRSFYAASSVGKCPR